MSYIKTESHKTHKETKFCGRFQSFEVESVDPWKPVGSQAYKYCQKKQ